MTTLGSFPEGSLEVVQDQWQVTPAAQALAFQELEPLYVETTLPPSPIQTLIYNFTSDSSKGPAWSSIKGNLFTSDETLLLRPDWPVSPGKTMIVTKNAGEIALTSTASATRIRLFPRLTSGPALMPIPANWVERVNGILQFTENGSGQFIDTQLRGKKATEVPGTDVSKIYSVGDAGPVGAAALVTSAQQRGLSVVIFRKWGGAGPQDNLMALVADPTAVQNITRGPNPDAILLYPRQQGTQDPGPPVQPQGPPPIIVIPGLHLPGTSPPPPVLAPAPKTSNAIPWVLGLGAVGIIGAILLANSSKRR